MWKSLSLTSGSSLVLSGYSGFLHQQNWPSRYSWNIVESGVKHHNPNPYQNKAYNLIRAYFFFSWPLYFLSSSIYDFWLSLWYLQYFLHIYISDEIDNYVIRWFYHGPRDVWCDGRKYSGSWWVASYIYMHQHTDFIWLFNIYIGSGCSRVV
jgi:hypothetical protein